MVSRLQRKLASRRKLHLLHSLLTHKLPGRNSPIFWNTLVFLNKLKLKLEAIEREYSNLLAMKRDYLNLLNHFHIPKEVKVEKVGEEFIVKVRCEKGEDRLVSILEAFDKMGLNVEQARVSCDNYFSMEAIAIAEDNQSLHVRDVTQAVTEAIGGKLASNEQQEICMEKEHVQI